MLIRLLIVIPALLLITSPVSAIIDYPHNSTNNIGCDSCHFIYGTQPSLLPPWTAHTPQDIDDTQYNTLCWSCHNDIDAPYVRTHSSLQTDNGYGNWTVECRVCHNPHYQKQSRTYGSASYLYSGTSTGVTTTTLTKTGAGWTTNAYAGYVVYPNVSQKNYNYKILSNTDEALTVEGPINLAKVTAGNIFAIVYGKLINNAIDLSKITIIPAKSGSKTTRFFNSTGSRSFADGDGVYDGICEVCHTQTNYHRNDGIGGIHNSGLGCTQCHNHVNGFAHSQGGGSNDCEECHGHDDGYADYAGGRGSYVSHSTHTENDPDDLRGPHIACMDCHETGAFPHFRSGTDSNGDGYISLFETDVCDICHSPNGAYDGVNDPAIGAKANWKGGVYDGGDLKTGKEKWCAGCHDDAPSIIGGISAPDIAGDDSAYGYYKSGHGLSSGYDEDGLNDGGGNPGANKKCTECHNSTALHINGIDDTGLTGHRIKTTINTNPAATVNEVCNACHQTISGSPAANQVLNHREAGPLGNECNQCHDVHGQNKVAAGRNLKLVKSQINSRAVKFYRTTGDNSYADGNSTFDGVCEVCHTGTAYHRNNSEGDHGHNTMTKCITCHPHANRFEHRSGGSGTGCDSCHGHDAGWQGNNNLGKGTFMSHSTHTENDSDDLKGPYVNCDTCHDTGNFPYFKSGIDGNGDGLFSLSETDVCNTCHSPEGAFDGVGDPYIGAKANWKNGVYTTVTELKTDKQKWCAGCHDDQPSEIQNVTAPNVMGDNAAWGYYISGHKIFCTRCHDLSLAHIDGNARTYSAAGDNNQDANNYKAGYRLKFVLRTNRDTVYQDKTSGCLSCHDYDKVLGNESNFVNEITGNWGYRGIPGGNGNWGTQRGNTGGHEHFGPAQSTTLAWDSDWNGLPDKNFIDCQACHNVHGSKSPRMIRGGELISTYGTEDKAPGLDFRWYKEDGITPTKKLSESRWGDMPQTRGPSNVSGNNPDMPLNAGYLPFTVCITCHGNRPVAGQALAYRYPRYYRVPTEVTMPPGESIDLVPPEISGLSPAEGADGISLDSNITFNLSDEVFGVDLSTFSIKLVGDKGYSKTYTNESAGVSTTGTPYSYQVTVVPDTFFGVDEKIEVTVTTGDQAPAPNFTSPKWNFTTRLEPWQAPGSVFDYYDADLNSSPENTIDGNTATQWRPFGNGRREVVNSIITRKTGRVIYDLGATYEIHKIRIYGGPADAYVNIGVNSSDVLVSGGTADVTNLLVKGSGWHESPVFNKTGRYITMFADRNIGGPLTDSIFEFNFKGHQVTGTKIKSITKYDEDKVVVKFNGATNGAAINQNNIDNILKLSNSFSKAPYTTRLGMQTFIKKYDTHSWLDGNGDIADAAWSNTTYGNDTLTIKFTGAQDAPSVAAGDIVTLDGTAIFDQGGQPVIDNFMIRDALKIKNVMAVDSGQGAGIQAGDKVVFRFEVPTGMTAINAANIDSLLPLSDGHSWLDGSGQIVSAEWSRPDRSLYYLLTITLSTNAGPPTVAVGDTVTISSEIKDRLDGESLPGSAVIGGSLGLPQGAAAYWPFDEAYGDIAYDALGSNNGDLINGAAWTTGKLAGALGFDGLDDYVSVNDDNVLDLSGDATIEAWVRVTDLPYKTNSDYDIVTKADTNGTNYRLFLSGEDSSHRNELAFSNGSNTYWSGWEIDRDFWHYIILVRNGTNMTFYVDGQTKNTVSAGWGSYLGSSLFMGSYLQGRIDEVVLYNRALEPEEILSRYNEFPVKISSAEAFDTSGQGEGIQAGDTVVIRFDGPTDGTLINEFNIDSALALDGGHTWTDEAGGIGAAVWSTTLYNNDTLTITLSTADGNPTVSMGSLITLDGAIKDSQSRYILDSKNITGAFGPFPGLVAYWKFDEGEGTAANDDSGNGNDGTLVNGTYWTTGKSSGALYFRGHDSYDYVNVGYSPSLNFSGGMTMAGWIKAASTENRRTIANISGYANRFEIGNGKLFAFMYLEGYGGVYLTGNTTIPSGEWTHVATTYDPTSGTLRLFVNGYEDASIYIAGQYTFKDEGKSLTIGGAGGNVSFHGAIDEFKVFNQALADAQIKALAGVYANTNSVPRQPANLLPADGSIITTLTPGLTASDYFDENGDAQAASKWQVRKAEGVYGGADFYEATAGAVTNHTVATNLENGTTYYWRVRYKDNTDEWSPYSNETAFTILPSGAIAYWRLDDGSGQIAMDSIGGINAILGSTSNSDLNDPAWTEGKIDKALSFISDDYLSLPNLSNVPSGSFEAWINPDDLTGTEIIWDSTNDAGHTAGLGLKLDGSNLIGIFRNADGSTYNEVSTTLPDANGHHVVMTWDTLTDNVSLYLNGAPGDVDTANNLESWAVQYHKLGADSSSPRDFYNGLIDEVLIYDRALTAEEVLDRYNDTNPAPIMGVPQSLSTSSIRWNFTGRALNETGFKLHDSAHTVKASGGPDITYLDETGLAPNTQYTRHIHSYGAFGDSPASGNAARYTLPAVPNVTADKTTGWQNTPNVVFTNNAGFGPGAVGYYRYVWDQNDVYYFSGAESQWSSGTLTQTIPSGENWYLHVKSYNDEGTPNSDRAYGPYRYDGTLPSISGLSPANPATGVAADTNLTFTISDTVSGIDWSTFSINLSGSNGYSKTYTGADTDVIYQTGTLSSYNVTVNPEISFGSLENITATVNVKDFAGNSLTPPAWLFTTEFTSAPLAPTMGTAIPNETYIRWNFTDNAGNEDGFRLHDSGHAVKSSSAIDNLSYLEETGLTPNTQYTRHVHAYNGVGDSSPSGAAAVYTLPLANVAANKTVSSNPDFIFTNLAGFGSGGVEYYRYIWDQNPVYTFNDIEPQWMSGSLTMNSSAEGSWYLHVKPYNAEHVANSTVDYGPYVYDITNPIAVNLRPLKGANYVRVGRNLNLTLSDTISGIDWSSFSINLSGDISYSKTYTDEDTSVVSKTGTPSSYNVTVDPDIDFSLEETITVTVNVNDMAGNPVTPFTWSFKTDYPLPSDLMAYWQFDETEGNEAWDSSGNENIAELIAGSLWTTGKDEGALDFDGNNYVSVPSSPSIDINGSFTIEAWVKPTLLNGRRIIAAKTDGNGFSGWIFGLNGDKLFGQQNKSYGYTATSITSLALDEWNHVAWTVSAAGLSRVYVNGSVEEVQGPAGGVSDINNLGMLIGAQYDGPIKYKFAGSIDDLKIYNRDFTPPEIWQDSQAAVSIKSVNADDSSDGGYGIQSGDKVVIEFNGPTQANEINSGNIDSALPLDNGHSWLDGEGSIESAVWSTRVYENDTLTITLKTELDFPTVSVRDVINMNAVGVITDLSGAPVVSSKAIAGTFGVMPNLAGYWKFDQDNGSVVYDDSGNFNDGNIFGTPNWTTGKYEGALYFDGNNYASVQGSPTININGSFTIEAWIKPTSLTGRRIIAAKTDGNGFSGWIFGLNGDKLFGQNKSYGYTATSITSLALDEWNHVAWTVSAAGLSRVYVNGSVEEVQGPAGGVSDINNLGMLIGAQYDGPIKYKFAGSIDDLKIYNRDLTPPEIWQDSQADVSIKSVNADDSSDGGYGIQSGDKVVIEFNGPTQANEINSGNIDSALPLDNGHSWLDGEGSIESAVWSTRVHENDTLTITLKTELDFPTVSVRDVINMNVDGVIKDSSGAPVVSSEAIAGTFGVTPNLAGYWKFDEATGSVFYDDSGNFNDGNISGTPNWTTGKDGGALYFDGINYASVPSSPTINITGSFTIEAWVKPTSLTGRHMIAAKTDGNGWGGWLLGLNGDKLFGHNRYYNYAATSTASLTLNEWTHVAWTVSAAGLSRVYLNGNVEEVQGSAGGVSDINNLEMLIGAQYSGGPNRYVFAGSIDDLKLYNRDLTPDEIAYHYSTFFPVAAPTIGTPLALSPTSIRWSFSEDSTNEVGFKVHDSSHTVKKSSATPDLTYLDETGLLPNTEYARHVHAYNYSGDSSASADASEFTLAAAPNIEANKSTSTWYNTDDIEFTNAAGFGSGGLEYYRYAWDQDSSHSFDDSETTWTAGPLTKTATANGNWYLHVKSYNSEDVSSGVETYGPYFYDGSSSMISALSPADDATGVAANTNLTFTTSDAPSGIDWSTFSIELSGSNGYSKTYTDADTAIVSTSGTPSSYSVTVNPERSFGSLEDVTVTVNIADFAGNALTPPEWLFTTQETPLPAAPTMQPPSEVTTSSIKWNFTDNAVNEDGFKFHDALHTMETSEATPNLSYFEDTGLVANTEYTRHVHTYNGVGESPASDDTSVYTLPLPPGVTADKFTSTWYTTPNVTFTNGVTFGSGGLEYYRYAWNQNSIHTFDDTETAWSSGTLTTTSTAGGDWYLHVKSYNGGGISNGADTIGPFKYDSPAPIIDNLSPAYESTPAANTNLSFTLSDGDSGIDWTSFSVTLTGDKGYSKTYTDTDTAVVSTSGNPSRFDVTVDPDESFEASETINVTVNVDDLAGNSAVPPDWSFEAVGMPPSVENLSPADGATDVLATTDLTFTLSSNGYGVNWSTFSITLTGNRGYSKTFTDLDTSIVSKAGSPASYDVTVNPDSDFSEGELITVEVNVNDFAGNSMTPPDWSFATEGAWLTGWSYRRPVTISNSDSTLTDYQISVNPSIYDNTGLAGSWHLSEGSGTTAKDLSGSKNNGTISGAAWTTGKFGNALNFDGSNDYVDFGDILDVTGLNYTLEAWIKTTGSPSDYQMIITKDGGNPNRSYNLFVYGTASGADNGKAVVRFGQDGSLSVQAYAKSATLVNDNNWHHILGVLDGGTAKLYVDGVLENTGSSISSVYNSSAPLRIGMSAGGTLRPFNGLIDESKVYNRALSGTEIADRYNSGNPKVRHDYQDIRYTGEAGEALPYWQESDSKFWVKVPSIPNGESTIYQYYGKPDATDITSYDNTFNKISDADTGLKGLWHMDEGTGQITDSSGNNNNSTSNTATWVGSDGGNWNSANPLQQFSGGAHLSFNGSSNYASFGDPVDGSFDFGTGEFSIAAWFKATARTDQAGRIVSKGAMGSASGYSIIQMRNNHATYPGKVFVTTADGANTANVGSNIVTDDGNWHFVVAVRDNTENKIKLYVDGVFQNETSSASLGSVSSASSLNIGANSDPTPGEYFKNNLDEVAIYNRALSLDEINAHYYRRKFANPAPTISVGGEESN